mgnify:CR=1 FL=1
MSKNYIPTINISSLIKNNFETQSALKTIKEIEKACVNIGFFQVTGHGFNLKEIQKICKVGNQFFNLPDSKKRKLSPKKWNKKNKNLYRGYFPNDVNGKEGLDIGDLKVTKKYSSKTKNQYIEYLNLDTCFNKTSIRTLNKYFENIYNLSETLFKSVIKLNIVPSLIWPHTSEVYFRSCHAHCGLSHIGHADAMTLDHDRDVRYRLSQSGMCRRTPPRDPLYRPHASLQHVHSVSAAQP